MAIRTANPRIFFLDKRHIIRDGRIWKSVADRYYGSEFRLKPEIEEWLADLGIEFSWSAKYDYHSLYIDEPKDAMFFKLTWM